MPQFHPFNGLPKELRDTIWDMTIRNDGPAVHFFTIYDIWNDHDSVIDPSKKAHTTRGDPYILSFRTGLAAPRDARKGGLSWTDGNVSTYLTDSGLWTACRESHERMLWRFRPSDTIPMASRCMRLDPRTTNKSSDSPQASVSVKFTRDNGERQYLTIHPSTDLICLQTLENSDISFGTRGLFDWQAIGKFPFFSWRDNEGHSCYSDIKNFAVEYDPAWKRSDLHCIYTHFRIVSGGPTFGEIPGLETFWFIDYRLTRKYKREESEGERRMFHAGRLAFIEVAAVDSEWCCCP